MNLSALRGSFPPVVTPFRDGQVDLARFAALVERQVAEGSHGVVVCGTTGESTSLTIAERGELFREAVRAATGRVPVVAGTGAASYEETLALTTAAERSGVDAVLVVTPYYVRPPQHALVQYFTEVGRRTALPMLLYHIPGRAAVSLTAETVARIAEATPNLVGMKHAATELDLVSELLLRLPEFRVFGGLESLSLPMLAVGAVGLMNAVGNLAPARVAQMCDAAAEGRWDDARRIHFELFELSQALFLETNPIPLKHMMSRLGLLDSPEVRLPLGPLDPAKHAALDDTLRRAGLLKEAAVVAKAAARG